MRNRSRTQLGTGNAPQAVSPANLRAAAVQRGDLRRSLVVGTAVAAVTALAATGVLGGGGATAVAAIDPGAPFGTIVLSLPSGASAVVTEAPSAAPSAAPSTAPTLNPNAAPELRIALTYQRRNRDLLLKLNFDGAVYLPYGSDDKLVAAKDPADRTIGLDESLEWGDGTTYRAASGNRCAKSGEENVLRAVKDTYELRKKYEKAGEYQLNYVFKACGLTGGQIAGSLKIRVP
ncbi:MAG: hypothetical protein ACT4QF_21115 [Sporichthyaceae bacterium]